MRVKVEETRCNPFECKCEGVCLCMFVFALYANVSSRESSTKYHSNINVVICVFPYK